MDRHRLGGAVYIDKHYKTGEGNEEQISVVGRVNPENGGVEYRVEFSELGRPPAYDGKTALTIGPRERRVRHGVFVALKAKSATDRRGAAEPDRAVLSYALMPPALVILMKGVVGILPGVDPESREETLLFNPRQDAWNEHFKFDAGRFQLLGTTPTGRATIDQLKMNTSYQIQAREYWVEAGLYP